MPNLSKETKQQIALNYAVDKMKTEKQIIVSTMNKFTNCYRESVLLMNNADQETLDEFVQTLNKMNSKELNATYYRSSINIGQYAMPTTVSDMEMEITPSNKVFTYFSSGSKGFDRKQTVTAINFDYTRFERSEFKELMGLETFASFYNQTVEMNKKFNESIQTHYDNLYELIKNVRTLDRIQKQFPQVDKYLPDDIIVNEDKKDIKKKFNEL